MTNLTTTPKTRKTSNQQATALLPPLDKKAMEAFLQANPKIDLAKVNFLNTENVAKLNWGQQDQAVLLPQLQALQRLVRLTHDLPTAMALYEQGLHAAVQIATIPQHQFVAQYASLFTPNGLSSEEQAQQVHQQALARKSQALLTYTALAQHQSPHYKATRFDNLSALTNANYNNLPSYQDLFGDLDFCTCDQCRSIFSPAAYFVDLMRLQANYISKDTQASSPAQLLDQRRPDLLEIPLDCDHTNTLVSKLQIVNEVLLSTLGQDATYEQLATTNYPFNLPFHLPLTQIQQYLDQNQQSLSGLWETLDPTLATNPTTALARQSLGFSPAQWTLYSTPQPDAQVLAPLYGLASSTDLVSTLTVIDTFLAQTGLSYTQLQELIYEDLSDWELKEGFERYFFINLDTTGETTGFLYIDTDNEKLMNLTLERLDAINRFVRLAQALNWSFTDLDWALRTIGTIVNTTNNSAPVINDAVLPYLAWIQALCQQHQLSINQGCALIGTVKDFGQKNGATFFDQVFNNASVPNRPDWKDNQGNYNLNWLVPSNDKNFPVLQSPQELQIQNALAAALHLSQDDLLRIANQVLVALAITNSQLPLTLANLSILYRLSQLPTLTGIGINECFIALGLPGQPKGTLQQLTGSSGAAVKGSFLLLQQFTQWLAKTPFSVYQLQFILTGTSQDPTIQNQVLGIDKITNFLNELQTAIQPTLLTQDQFTTALYSTLQNIFGNQTGDLATQIYTTLQDAQVNYLNQQGVVTAIGATATTAEISQALSTIFIPLIPLIPPTDSSNQEAFKSAPLPLIPLSWEQVINLIFSTLQNSYQLQQKTLTQQLASLYNVSPNLVHALEVWGGLTLGDLETTQATSLNKDTANSYASQEHPYAAVPLLQKLLSKPAGKWRKARVLSTENQAIVKHLQVLQQYAALLTNLALAPVEVQALLAHPQCFGMSYNTGNPTQTSPQFTLGNVQTLYQFKQLVQGFQDTQNHLLDYFQSAATIFLDKKIVEVDKIKAVAELLAKITQWNVLDIQFLLQQLWPSADSVEFPMYATVMGIGLLQTYFNLAQQLNLDIVTLWQLGHAMDITDYAAYVDLADALWGGLQTQYQDQPNVLSTLQGKLDEAKRTALLGLVIYQLRKSNNLPITTARDLYEYLLIDVATSGAVQTSYVKEAISTVQLYIYRCLNNLEPGILVAEELNTWWPWLEHYRVWQANREVFLYPENYIEPELRHDKTPQFIQLENDLQQSNLTNEVVNKAVKTYVDGFAQVATLQIVGSYLYANDNTSSNQTLYLVGRTNTQAYTYYYRSATFTYDAKDTYKDTYIATQWTPWIKINLQIKSTLAAPVYAFNRLFLFWAEAKPGPSDTNSQGQATNKRFETTLYYAFYDLNQQWSAPQQLLGPILLPDDDDINTQADAETFIWQQVRTVFDPIAQLIYWSWGPHDSLQAGTLNKQLGVQTGFRVRSNIQGVGLVNSPGAVVYQDMLYCFFQGKDQGQLYFAILQNGKWSNQQVTSVSPIDDSPNAVVYQDDLYCFYRAKSSLYYAVFQNKDGHWENQLVNSATMLASPSSVVYQDTLYCFYQAADPSGTLWYCTLEKDGKWSKQQVPGVNMVGSPNAVVYQDTLYCFYQGANPTNELWYCTFSKGRTWSNRKVVSQGTNELTKMLYNPSAVVYQDTLYCFYQSDDPIETLWYCTLEDNGTWSNNQVNLASMTASPSALVYQDKLYYFYQGTAADGTQDGIIWYGNVISPLSIRALNFLDLIAVNNTFIENIPVDVVAGTQLTWSIDPGPRGTQFLTIPNQANTSKQYIRLNAPVVHELIEILFSQGMDGFLSINTQQTPELNIDGSKTETLDLTGANGLYYWELFFHMPFLIGHSLSTQQQFELAKKWYAYIFNPTISQKDWNITDQEDSNDKYWRFLGLRSLYNTTLQTELDETWANEVQADVQDASQLYAYHNDPFDPHAIARLRPIAYQKTLVMHYLDNLLAWGDNLFRQYTMETLVEATMLYVMAYDLLGKQPVSLGACPLPATETLQEIASSYDNNVGKIPEFLIEVEQSQARVLAANAIDTPHNYIPGDYFGLPENDQFIAYWNTVEQRLYNIRHNLNINGIYQRLPLFEPRINPMHLVGAVAAGEGISQDLSNNQVDVPYYRFGILIAKAQSMAQTVTQLGQSLLSVLEKQDAEQLTLLYSSNQKNLLALTRTSKQDQLEAATQTLQSLQASLQNAQDRSDHYTQLLNAGYSIGEQAQIALEVRAVTLQAGAQAIKAASVAGYLIPTIFGASVGGFQPGEAISQGANILEGTGNVLSMSSNLAATVAGYQRRSQDWQLQQKLAQDDINQIQYQIVAAQYQEHMASEEMKLLEKQIEQEQAVEAFLKNKFTRVQLYQWMTGKFAALYFQAYQLAYSLALQAEKAWQFEQCKPQIFINPIYWDNLYQGLVAGEALQLDLQRMEKAYMDQDVRKFEIEKTISLAQLDPQAFQNLKATGSCSFNLTEQEFDYDYPGQYARQIKSLSLSFPALLGPYQNVHATLTQTGSKTLLKADANGVKYLLGKVIPQPDGSVLRVDMRANQQVALSQGLNDSGLFVLNFDDPRYLPFEGTGAVSSWQLNMPLAYNPINFDSLTDVIIRLQYTALPGDNVFQTTVKQNLGQFKGYQPLFMAQGYASAWYSFIQQGQPLGFSVSPALFRPNLTNYTVTGITVMLMLTAVGEAVIAKAMPTLILTFKTGDGKTTDLTLQQDPTTGMLAASVEVSTKASTAAEWHVVTKTDTGKLMTAANVSNMVISLQYSASFSS